MGTGGSNLQRTIGLKAPLHGHLVSLPSFHMSWDVAAGLATLGTAGDDAYGRPWMLPCAPAETMRGARVRGRRDHRPWRLLWPSKSQPPMNHRKIPGLYFPISVHTALTHFRHRNRLVVRRFIFRIVPNYLYVMPFTGFCEAAYAIL
jgi:hypothetical protein